ncbi:hypothetical protein GIB67_014252 [Kingdonia uniflora]|uniref:Uncharacterized protein n=1 Tax=Kingdonia uniflora TaxID=39325 RepID=A0A7J7M1Y4_9MAGN|nr:hypothetical protein GIB67_014252 [Kingdonia uniflora]
MRSKPNIHARKFVVSSDFEETSPLGRGNKGSIMEETVYGMGATPEVVGPNKSEGVKEKEDEREKDRVFVIYPEGVDVFKSLYENASDSTHIRVHLAILSAIRDVCKLLVKELTSWVQQSEGGEFSACTTPTGFDPRNPFDMGIQRGPRMFNSTHQDMILRRKLEEAELQQAIEFQSKSGSAPICSPHSPHMNHNLIVPPSSSSDRSSPDSPSPQEICGSPPSIIIEKNVMNDEKEEFPNSNNHDDYDFHNSNNSNNIINNLEHNLPDSPFASPTKSGGDNHPFFPTITSETDKMSLSSSSSSTSTNNNSLIPSSLLPTAATSTLDISSYKLCFFPITRFSSGHGAIGM